jgi:hypothetical protein
MTPTNEPEPPDLQELVRRFGRYDQIPPEAWAAFDRRMAEFQQARRADLEAASAKHPKKILRIPAHWKISYEPGTQYAIVGMSR